MTMESNSIDILVCDEAHRIRKNSNNRYTKREARSDKPQIDELIDVAKLSIFFIDENQIVRPDEIGSLQLIKDAALRFGIDEADIAEFELKTQFRCSGSDAYLQWLDKTLGITDSESTSFDARMRPSLRESARDDGRDSKAKHREEKLRANRRGILLALESTQSRWQPGFGRSGRRFCDALGKKIRSGSGLRTTVAWSKSERCTPLKDSNSIT